MSDVLEYDNNTIKKCLEVLSYTARDLLLDYKEAISQTSQNGIFQATWARRSDLLRKLFENDKNIKVLHIKRGGIWQFDPILNLKTGELIVFFSKSNFRVILHKYFQKGVSTHYSLSLLLKNEGLYDGHVPEQLTFPLFTDDFAEKERKQADLIKMLGVDCENVTSVKFLIVDYLQQFAVSARLEVYSPMLDLIASEDVSHLLPNVADTITTEMVESALVDSLDDEPQLVTMKMDIKGN